MCDLRYREMDTIAYMSPRCPYLPGCTGVLWLHCNSLKCVCLFSGLTRLTYSIAFYFLLLAANNLKLQSFR